MEVNEWSPEKISLRLRLYHPEKYISAQSIDNMIKRHGNENLKIYLYEKGKKRRSDIMSRRSRLQKLKLILLKTIADASHGEFCSFIENVEGNQIRVRGLNLSL